MTNQPWQEEIYIKSQNKDYAKELIKMVSELLQEEREGYRNEAGEAMVKLCKIIDFNHITEDTKNYASVLVQHYNKQNEINYVRHLEQKSEEQFTAGYKAGRDGRNKEVLDLIERVIQEERFAGAPYALNKIKELINKDERSDNPLGAIKC